MAAVCAVVNAPCARPSASGTADCDSIDWVKRAKDVLRETGAQDIAAAEETKGDFANADKPMPRVRTMGSGAAVAEEDLYGDHGQRPPVTAEVRASGEPEGPAES